MLRIALPNKGRLADEARELFNDAGLEIRAKGERALTASLGGEFEALFVRAVAAREESGVEALDDVPAGARIATAFPRLTERFFAERELPIEVVPVSGAAEIAPHLGIADIIVDLVSTGSTLRVNGLREVATVLESTARLVVADGGLPQRGVTNEARLRELDDLVAALQSVLRARGQRYVMANVPRDQLDAVRRILPGITGPTVIDLLNGGAHVAVHAVTPAAGIYRTIAQLKGLGAEGILVTRIERLMP
jgi:ATP phosphoribosyltransferase